MSSSSCWRHGRTSDAEVEVVTCTCHKEGHRVCQQREGGSVGVGRFCSCMHRWTSAALHPHAPPYRGSYRGIGALVGVGDDALKYFQVCVCVLLLFFFFGLPDLSAWKSEVINDFCLFLSLAFRSVERKVFARYEFHRHVKETCLDLLL